MSSSPSDDYLRLRVLLHMMTQMRVALDYYSDKEVLCGSALDDAAFLGRAYDSFLNAYDATRMRYQEAAKRLPEHKRALEYFDKARPSEVYAFEGAGDYSAERDCIALRAEVADLKSRLGAIQ